MGSRAAQLLTALQTGREERPSMSTSQGQEWAVQSEMAEMYRLVQAQRHTETHRSYKAIPRFHHRPMKHSANKVMQGVDLAEGGEEAEHAQDRTLNCQKLKALARARFLERREAELIDTENIVEMGRWMDHIASPPAPREESEEGENVGRVNYDDFCKLEAEVSSAARRFFTARHFLQCPRDKHGRISRADFMRHMYDKVGLEKIRLELYCYDTDGKGYLREHDLESYIGDAVPTTPALHAMPENFFLYYCFTAVRRFMFFLDNKHTGKVSIDALVRSGVMSELRELSLLQPPEGGEGEQESGMEVYYRRERAKNWFSYENAMRVYSMYLELDRDRDGLLGKQELLGFGSHNGAVRLTAAFVDRLFEECMTYRIGDGPDIEAEMDYKVFLDFVLAWENKHTVQSLKYFFRLLDIRHEGMLTPFSIRYFFREVCARLQEFGVDVLVDDVKDEMFDMAQPKDPRGITVDDLINCGVGALIVSMLIDVNAFLAYDNRENTLAAPTESTEA